MIGSWAFVAGRVSGSGYRHLERYADAGIGQVYAIDQGLQRCSGFDLLLQALSPRCCRQKERWKSIVR
jgi:hypothetical protein